MYTQRELPLQLWVLAHTTQDVQYRTGGNHVRSPVTQRRAEITEVWFVEKRDEIKERGGEDEQRAEQLHRALPAFVSIREIGSDAEIQQTCQQYEDVSGAIKQSWTISHTM